MRIARVGVIEADCILEGVEFWQEDLVRPHDWYRDRFDRGLPEGGFQTSEGWSFTTRFLELEAECGAKGTAGPITEEVARAILGSWVDYLILTPSVTPRRAWDEGYRRMPHGRLGQGVLSLSAIELALWDLWGNIRQEPVVALVGGPTRREVPAYASMLGFTVTDLDRSAELARQHQEQGYAGQKWFFRYGPSAGHAGLEQNLALARTVRAAVGDGYPLMFDAWQSLDVDYAARLAAGLREIEPTWLEEPLLPDQAEGLARLRQRTLIPIAGGEHAYTRWGQLPYLRRGLYDVLQPDLYWAGGFLETMRIAALAEGFDVKVMAHAHSANATAHFSFAQSPATTAWQEHLLRWNLMHQHLLTHPAQPVDGVFEQPSEPGFGMTLDLDRAVRWRYM